MSCRLAGGYNVLGIPFRKIRRVNKILKRRDPSASPENSSTAFDTLWWSVRDRRQYFMRYYNAANAFRFPNMAGILRALSHRCHRRSLQLKISVTVRVREADCRIKKPGNSVRSRRFNWFFSYPTVLFRPI